MRRLFYLGIAGLLIASVLLINFSPDMLSMLVTIVMLAIIALGLIFGIFPTLSYMSGFARGTNAITKAMDVQTSSTWQAIIHDGALFQQKTLDKIFSRYEDKVQQQQETGQVLSDIEEYINEDILSLHSRQNVILQIPSTLTGLGILGTFVGLLMGIHEIGFTTVDAALISVQSLIDGIELAFYTSIAGVILSILFNLLNRTLWNLMARELGLFIEDFHNNVIPSVEEQVRYRERKDMENILEKLDRLPKRPEYSISNPASGVGNGNEQVLMPQILSGLKNGEFIFHVQPKFDLNARTIIGGEALVRWQHSKLGLVSPAVFMPVVESNGYITKLDQHIWELVCRTQKERIDNGEREVPLAINVSKTDILAFDVAKFFTVMLKKYQIPPRSLEIEIAENAYIEAGEITRETASQLREKGFRVIVDGFDGDYIALDTQRLNADALKLDLRRHEQNRGTGSVQDIFAKAKKLQLSMSVEGIETMEQLSNLRKSGCSEGQGYYMSKPVSLEDFETMVSGD